MENNSPSLKTMFIAVSAFICFIILFSSIIYNLHVIFYQKTNNTIIENEILVEDCEFNDTLFYDYLVSLNVMFPKIVYAQSYLETGIFKSPLFKENNNLFGMKIPRQRATLNIGTLEFAKFNNWKECVLDYTIWQAKYCGKLKTEIEYLDYLQKVYAENKLYKKLILKIVNNDSVTPW